MTNTTMRTLTDASGKSMTLERLPEGELTIADIFASAGLTAPTAAESVASGSGTRYAPTDAMPVDETDLSVVGQTRNG